MFKVFYRQPSGQGLLEATVAIAVLITGLVSIVSLTLSNLTASQGTEARLVAASLAREGIEAVRSVRDRNWLQGKVNVSGGANAWDEGLISGSDTTAIATIDVNTLGWTIDFVPTAFTDARTKLRRHQARGLYRQSSEATPPAEEVATPFARLLTMYPICRNPGGSETNDQPTCAGGFTKVGVRVVSTAQWQEGGKTRSVSLEEWLYNWRFSPYVP